MKRKTSTSDSSSADMVICKKMKEDVDSSDDEITIKPSRSSNPCVSKRKRISKFYFSKSNFQINKNY